VNVGLLSRVAALFHKERKVRMAPQQWAEVECLTGLEEAVDVTLPGHYHATPTAMKSV